MKLRWRRGIAALLTAVVLLSMPGGLELTAAATETVQETVSKRNSEYDLVMDTSGQMIVGYTGEPVDLVIPEGTVSIGDRAFQNCTTLASVQFPDSLEEVGVEALTGCTALSLVARHSLIVPASKVLLYQKALRNGAFVFSVSVG